MPANSFFNKISDITSLWLNANIGKTTSGGLVSQWNDQSGNSNNAVQATDINKPTDGTTYLIFDGNDNMSCGSGNTLNITDKITLYTKFVTSAATNFMGFIDKYIGSTSGYLLYLNASKKPVIAAKCSKFEPTLVGNTVCNDGILKTVTGTIECTRKFFNKQWTGIYGELPCIIKSGSEYWLYYDWFDGVNYNIYKRVGTSPNPSTFGSATLVLANHIYARVTKVGSTYRMYVSAQADLTQLKLYTSSDGNTWGFQAVVLTTGIVGSDDATYCDNAGELIIGGIYYIFYEGWKTTTNARVLYATSTDGINFTKQGRAIDNGASDTFESDGCVDPAPYQYDINKYILYYTGFNNSRSKQMQAFATSTDGITWTKYSGNPIHYFTGESFESGTFGPNEFTVLVENGIHHVFYRSKNDNPPEQNKISYLNFTQDSTTLLPISGNEKVELKTYVNNTLETIQTNTGLDSIDYIINSTQDVIIGGDNVSTLYFTGHIHEAKVYNKIKTSI